MISERRSKLYCCEDISLIENYKYAIEDTTQIWECHHRLEIQNGIFKSDKELKSENLYYSRPASELIFLTHKEHKKLHSDNPKYRTLKSSQQQGTNNNRYGIHLENKTKDKISKALKEKFKNKEFLERHKSIRRIYPKIRCIETNECKYASEWIKLGYTFVIKVAKGENKSCKNLHFEFIEDTKGQEPNN